MNTYLATFYTHSDALVSHRSLTAAGISARMMPVPRRVSASCGTCVCYESATPMASALKEYEAIYRVEALEYRPEVEAP